MCGGRDERAAALAAFGIEGPADEPEPTVWEENRRPLAVFSRLGGAWRYHPMGDRIGLDWSQVEATLRLMAIPRAQWPPLAEALRWLEEDVLAGH